MSRLAGFELHIVDRLCLALLNLYPELTSHQRFAYNPMRVFVYLNFHIQGLEYFLFWIGAGQMSRIYSAKIAGIKAAEEGFKVEGSVMASDAFFPFRDGIEAAAKAGIKAIIHPGGSIRDYDIIAAANENSIAMVFTGMRHFKH